MRSFVFFIVNFFTSLFVTAFIFALSGVGIEKNSNLPLIVWAVIFIIFWYAFKKKSLQLFKRKRMTNFHFTDEGYYPLGDISARPAKIKANFGFPRMKELTVLGFLLDKQGYPIFQVRDEFDNEVFYSYQELTSLIHYNNETYHTFNDFLLACTNKKFFQNFLNIKDDYLYFLKNGSLTNE